MNENDIAKEIDEKVRQLIDLAVDYKSKFEAAQEELKILRGADEDNVGLFAELEKLTARAEAAEAKLERVRVITADEMVMAYEWADDGFHSICRLISERIDGGKP